MFPHTSTYEPHVLNGVVKNITFVTKSSNFLVWCLKKQLHWQCFSIIIEMTSRHDFFYRSIFFLPVSVSTCHVYSPMKPCRVSTFEKSTPAFFLCTFFFMFFSIFLDIIRHAIKIGRHSWVVKFFTLLSGNIVSLF